MPQSILTVSRYASRLADADFLTARNLKPILTPERIHSAAHSLVHATVALTDDRVNRAQDLLARAMRATHTGQRRQKDDRSLARRPAGSVGR